MLYFSKLYRVKQTTIFGPREMQEFLEIDLKSESGIESTKKNHSFEALCRVSLTGRPM